MMGSQNETVRSNNTHMDYYYYNYEEYYQYDYNDSADYLPIEEVVPVTIIYGLTFILGTVGNLLVIFSILRFRRMKNVTNVFLLSLSSADLLLILLCVPIKGISFFCYTWRLGEFLCKFVHYMQNVSMICSVMTLTVMSIERFIAVRYPLKARSICTIRHARGVLLIVWVLAFVMAVPIIFGQKQRTIVGKHRTAHWCVKKWSPPDYSVLYELYMLVVIFIIPVAVMAATYTRISMEVWHVVIKRADMRNGVVFNKNSPTSPESSSQGSGSALLRKPGQIKSYAHKEDDNTKTQVILMLMTIVALFIICWGPILINNVLVAFEVLDELHMGPLKHMRIAFNVMSYANSCVNPIVYGFMSKNFRQSFKQALCSCCIKDSRGAYLERSYRSLTLTSKASMKEQAKRIRAHCNGMAVYSRADSTLSKTFLDRSSAGFTSEQLEMRRIVN